MSPSGARSSGGLRSDPKLTLLRWYRARFAASQRLRAAVSLSASLMCVGCGSHPTAMTDVGIRVEMFLSKTELVLPQDSLVVRVVATNITRRPQTIEVVNCNTNYRLLGEGGVVLPHVPNGCMNDRSMVRLEPGKQIAFTRVWLGQLYSAAGSKVLAAPGTYRLVGFVPSTNTGLLSEPVAIRVRAAE